MKLLVLSASVGAGHMRAAQALALALKAARPDAEVRSEDVLDLSNRAFRRVYSGGYLSLAARAPHMLGYLYDRWDQPSRSTGALLDRMRLCAERLNLGALAGLLEAEPWDAVVSTHFLPAEIAASLRRRGRLRSPLATVVTDFEAHRIWAHSPCELYLAAGDEAAACLISMGVPEERIQTTGIPIHPDFSRPLRREDCRLRLGLAGDRPVILQLCGGAGMGPVQEVFRSLLRCEAGLELVCVTGRNEVLRRSLLAEVLPARHRVHVLGYTERMREWMAAADIIVGKPGGLSVSEALAAGVPWLVVDPIPGQESRNSDYLLENRAGLRATPRTLCAKLQKLLADPARMLSLRHAALLLGRPRSAAQAAQAVCGLAERTAVPA
jgi:processive 1,2-diacylglycerol beta-glucosyltransferase